MNGRIFSEGHARARPVFNSWLAVITADFRAGDIGYVKKALGHYVENTGNTELVYMEVFRADRFQEVSLSDWLAHSPPDMVAELLNLDPSVIAQFPKNRPDVVPAGLLSCVPTTGSVASELVPQRRSEHHRPDILIPRCRPTHDYDGGS